MLTDPATEARYSGKRALNGVILIIDDDEVDRMACRRALSTGRFAGFHIVEAELGQDGLLALEEVWPDFVLLDYCLPDADGLDILRHITEGGNDGPAVVMLTGARELETAVSAMRLGARDYLIKDADKNYLKLLPDVLERIQEEHALREQKRQAEEALQIANQNLEQRVMERTAELAEANRALAHEVEMRKRISDVLFAERERVMITLTSIADAVFVMDNDGRVVQMNPAAERLTGMRSEELINQFLCERITFLEEGSRAALNSPPHMCAETLGAEPLILIRPSGEELIVAPSGGAIHDSSGNPTGVVTVLRDITRERARTHRLMYQATHDALTDLPNRQLFSERLSQHIYHASRNAERLAVVFLDLDGFKRVNDTFGHRVGDNLLQSVAHRLRTCVREGDSLARLAGDEFTMLVSGKGADKGVEILASKVVRELTTPFDIEGNQIKIGTSVGISIFPDDGASVDELMEKADAAMYQVKVQGGGAFRYYAHQHPM